VIPRQLLVYAWRLSLTQKPGGIASDDRPGLNVLHDHGPGRKDGTFAKDHVGTDISVGANPHLVRDGDGILRQAHRWITKIMTSPAKMGALRNRDLGADF